MGCSKDRITKRLAYNDSMFLFSIEKKETWNRKLQQNADHLPTAFLPYSFIKKPNFCLKYQVTSTGLEKVVPPPDPWDESLAALN